jgi:hypothetical protein
MGTVHEAIILQLSHDALAAECIPTKQYLCLSNASKLSESQLAFAADSIHLLSNSSN